MKQISHSFMLYLFLIFALLPFAAVIPAENDFWEPASYSIAGQINSVVQNSSGDFFVCTEKNIFRSTDGGENWNELSIENSEYLEYLAITRQGILFVGTQAGVFQSTDN